MPTYKTRQAEGVFDKLDVEQSPSTHHRRGFLIDDTTGCKLFPPIHFNKGNKDIYDNVARKMRLSFRLTVEEFDELMRCRMSKREYFEIRRKRDLR
jgi:hypothetical protein